MWLSPVYRSPMADNGYDISDYQDVDPLFGTLEQLDELIAQLHARDMKLVMDLVVNHTSSAHAWFAESRSSTDNPKRDWYWWRPPRPGHAPGTPGAEPTNWGSAFSGPGVDLRRPHRRVLPAPVRARAARPQLGEPGGAAGGLRDDALLAGPRGRRLPDGRHQRASRRWSVPTADAAGRRLERDPLWPGSSTRRFADTTPFVVNGPRVHEFLQEMHREVFAGRPPGLLNVGETPGCSVEEAVLYTDPARGELDMVFQFEHVDLDSGPKGKWDILPMTMLQLKQSLGRWQDGLAASGGTASTSETTTSRAA